MTTKAIFHFIKYIFPLGILIYGTWCGLGYTYDSYDYLSAARSFAEKSILLNANGSPYIIHAPFFPIWLSWIGHDSLIILKIIHLALFVASLSIIDRIIRKSISSYPLQMITFLAISMGVGLHMIHHFIWTEPTFFLFFLIHNLCLISIIKSHRISTLSVLILSGFMLGITRNAGIFLIVPTGISLFFYASEYRLKSAFTYLIFAGSGCVLWNVYALMVVNELNTFKPGGSLFQDIFASIWVYPDVISKWFLPSFIPFFLRIIILCVSLIVVFILLRKKLTNPIPKVFFIQFFVYLVCITPIIVVENSEGEKLLSIVYPFFIISLFVILDSFWAEIKKAIRLPIYIALSIWLGYTSVRTVKNSIMWHNNKCDMETTHILGDRN